jgi:ketosteroid isomerase-like protein
MSQGIVEIVRRMNAAFNRRDRDALLAYYHPDVELRDLHHRPDATERLIGIDAIDASRGQWDDAFDDLTGDLEEYLDADTWVRMTTRWGGKGKGSGSEIDLRAVEAVEFADGKIARLTRGYSNKGRGPQSGVSAYF